MQEHAWGRRFDEQRSVVECFAVAALLAFFAGGSSACGPGGAGEAVRPKDPSASSALGEAGPCTGVAPEAQPFLVDWKDEARGELEIAMQKGVAVLAYSCDRIELLRDCHLAGEYGFASYDTVKRKSIDLTSNDDVRATLPLSAVDIGAELQRGLSLELAYAIVGQKGTTVQSAAVGDLVGSCRGATHYVRGAFVGAFQFGTSTKGSVAGGAGAMGVTSSAKSDSSRAIHSSDGDVSACDEHVDGHAPPSGCRALIRLMLAPIADEAARDSIARGGAHDDDGLTEPSKLPSSPCSPGYVLESSGKCTKKSTATSFACEPTNLSECSEQCARGDGPSCYSAGTLQARAQVAAKERTARDDKAAALFVSGCDAGHAPSCGRAGDLLGFVGNADKAKTRAFFDKGCNGGDSRSCMQMALHHEMGSFDGVKDPAAAFRLRQRACSLGSALACSRVAKAEIEGNGVRRDVAAGLKTLQRSCDGGDYFNCRELALLLARPGAAGVPLDKPRAEGILNRLCTKSPEASPNACDDLATLYGEGVYGPPRLDKMRELLERGCGAKSGNLACVHLAQMYETGKGAPKDAARALALYERSCPGKGCFGAATYYERGGSGIVADARKAAELYAKTCRPNDDKDAPGQAKQSCDKAASLFLPRDRDKAKGLFGKSCVWFNDAKSCAVFKSLGGDPTRPLAAPPSPPPGPRT